MIPWIWNLDLLLYNCKSLSNLHQFTHHSRRPSRSRGIWVVCEYGGLKFTGENMALNWRCIPHSQTKPWQPCVFFSPSIIPIRSHSSSLNTMFIHVFLNISYPSQSPWIPIKSHEIPWNPMRSHWIPWIPIESHEFPLNPMKSHEIPWDPIESHEFPRIPMKSHEIPWIKNAALVQALNDPQVQSALVQAAQETGSLGASWSLGAWELGMATIFRSKVKQSIWGFHKWGYPLVN